MKQTATTEPQAAPKPARGPSLLCESHVRDFIKETAKRVRPGSPFERVSDEALAMIEYKLRKMITGSIKSHRSGKTFKDVI